MPKRIGKYEITAEIGRGGFSRVYRGFDPNVNRPIAIKVSTRESDPEHLSRFRNEASAAGNLRHENIVTVYDYGDDDGVPYLVMELLDGRDLHHIMRDGPKMSVLEKMQVMSQVGEGLRCAHLNGVVHRDIKPANVMALTDGTVKILDFGIARMTGEVSRLTQSGYLVGTPLYMSPEQLQGGDADALCDVWAYGVLYFELLTGQHPFLSQDNTRLIRNIQIVNPPSVHSLTRGIPEGLAQVIRRALTKDRRRRYQSLEEVLVDTNPILGLLQREQTTGLVNEAQFYRNSGQLAAARQSSRKALEIDPSNYGAQQLLKSIQNEMHSESLAAPEELPQPVMPAPAMAPPPPAHEARFEPIVPVVPHSIPPPPPAPVRMMAVPPPPPPAIDEDLPEMILPETPVPSAAPAFAAPTPFPAVAPASAIPAPPTPVPSSLPIAPAAAALSKTSPSPNGPLTPSPSTTQRFRPSLATGGAAAAIAAAVAAAKARQAEEERQTRENHPEDEQAITPIKSKPLVVSALPTSRVVPAPQPTAALKRAENGSSVFVTDDPLVVKRPATAVMTQRMRSAESAAAVATPPPAPPPTRLPGTKAIPTSVSRVSNGTAELIVSPTVTPAVNESRRPSENLPMRRPPSEVYAKGKRKNSSGIFSDREQKKAFPWAVVGFVFVVCLAAAALITFALSAPKIGNTPTLQPDKLTFSWKSGTPKPAQQVLRLKGGPSSASFSASSSDDEWLLVTPVSDEPSNRSWEVKVDPEKVGPTGPNGTSGWIDVVSTEGFKTQEEVIVKVLAAPASGKTTKAAPASTAPNTPAVVPAVPALKKPAAASPQATAKPLVNSNPAATTKPGTATNTKSPATKKPVSSDGIDIN
jgi:serine/threonine protein kinase